MATSKHKSKKTTAPVSKRSARPAPSRSSKPVAVRAAVRPVPVSSPSGSRTTRFSNSDLEVFRKELMILRDRLTGQVARMRQDSLKRDDEVNPEEDGTDAFDRLFALERAGSDQDRIFTIDEAIRGIKEGKYGVCEGCGNLIEKPRLHALPFAKNCIKCQSEMERGRNGRR